jgi:hypothetical protein
MAKINFNAARINHNASQTKEVVFPFPLKGLYVILQAPPRIHLLLNTHSLKSGSVATIALHVCKFIYQCTCAHAEGQQENRWMPHDVSGAWKESTVRRAIVLAATERMKRNTTSKKTIAAIRTAT